MAPREAPADAFGRTAREYELGRPGWPEELLDRVIEQLGLAPDAEVLDLGAGTGKLTRLLVSRFARVVAVEPDHAMRGVLEEFVPGAESLAGGAEAIPLADAKVDAVFCAEAFHWFASDETVAEIARVLRPGGALVVLWSLFGEERDPPLGAEAEAVLDEAFARGGMAGGPKVTSGLWREPLERSAFGELREDEHEWVYVTSRDEWIAHILSVSSIAHQPDEDRLTLAARLRELVPEGDVRRPFRTVAYWTRLV
jgi:SAM-dependent methyltransferase